ncbi:DUF2156 domain-containing protein [Nocardioides sp. CER19]|uniref:bifunctional lysylphosphatidylglycerol flippase/synthetase MprF n=1 Tax=Nocardioides sp. CER19 TaxID=3038538 RepID=UPI00244A4080|nr:DUF2156 domain-containing protein [Nocardioides sp. CER19]MDH2416091.1 DUF2156 domain-containing protein [Nocardioides sp. CER19]
MQSPLSTNCGPGGTEHLALSEKGSAQEAGPATVPDAERKSWHRVRAAFVRAPFTATVVAIVVLAGAVTGALWSPVQDDDWFRTLEFGPSALFENHRWWTLLTGPVFALAPWQYPLMLGFFTVLVGPVEWLLGSRVALWGVVVGQAVGAIGGGLLVLGLAHTPSEWARVTAQQLDVGFSAGALGALMVATAALRPPWRGRLRLAVLGCVLTSLVFLGFLHDAERLMATLAGWWVGPRLVARPEGRSDRPASIRGRGPMTRRVRLVAAGLYFWGALLTLVGQFVAHAGPFGSIGGDPGPWWRVAPLVVLDVAIGLGLLRGRRTWWRLASIVTLASWLGLLAAVLASGRARNPDHMLALLLVIESASLLLLACGRSAFSNLSPRTRHPLGPGHIGAGPTELDRRRARALLTDLGSANRLSWMTTWPSHRLWFTPAPKSGKSDGVNEIGGGGAVAYRLRLGVALGLCDPIAPHDRLHAVADEFVEAARDAGKLPCFFSASNQLAAWARDRGWLAIQVAEEAVIDLPGLEFRGKHWQDVRSAFNQARRRGIDVRWWRLVEAPEDIAAQIDAICERWVQDKALPEMGFTLGSIVEARDTEVWVAVAVDAKRRVHGVTSWMPISDSGGRITGWTLDLMRRRGDSFRYTMELLIAASCLRFRDEGAGIVSLSGAPLARTDDARGTDGDRREIEAVLRFLAERLEPYYGFRSLQSFKAKFQPRFEPLYLLVSDEAALPLAGLAILRSYLEAATAKDLLTLTRRRAPDGPVPPGDPSRK